MKNEFTNMIIDLSWSDKNKSIMALQESFKISHYSFCLKTGKHRPSLSQEESKKLSKFLTEYGISFEATPCCNEKFISFKLDADLYMSPNHHIELRAN